MIKPYHTIVDHDNGLSVHRMSMDLTQVEFLVEDLDEEFGDVTMVWLKSGNVLTLKEAYADVLKDWESSIGSSLPVWKMHSYLMALQTKMMTIDQIRELL